jgi:hypothetical protein
VLRFLPCATSSRSITERWSQRFPSCGIFYLIIRHFVAALLIYFLWWYVNKFCIYFYLIKFSIYLFYIFTYIIILFIFIILFLVYF